MKKCSKCKADLDDSLFSKDSKYKSGLRSACKACERTYSLAYAQAHRDEHRKRTTEFASKQQALGLCSHCSSPLFLNSKNCCERHWYEKVAYANLRTRYLGKELQALAIKQDFICPYTGFTLIPTINMSLDHIVPKVLGGTNDISNLQWVDTQVNLMKRSTSEVSFIKLCGIIFTRNQAKLAK